ncbi:MAG: bifunctional diaminohydroxyphosphoribosylaminopyrimidine deaminase/5-amino-6-(5-phosphoribosylamino)uracil reductase RibD [Pseudomonadota bacterium]
MEFNEFDHAMMRQVLKLAGQGRASTQPNPMVGCVLVNEGKVVGEGFHVKTGGLHAERNALLAAGDKARGGTAYVNLEPCCHQGRTPPCTDGLIDAGITRVVAAMADPNPLVAGGGFDLLKSAGVSVANGLMEKDARWLNRGFVTRMVHQRPWVKLKVAATMDGKTAAADGQSQWITGDQSRTLVHELRAQSAAVLTGIGTVLADNPSLTVRAVATERQPARVVLDSQFRTPLDFNVVNDEASTLLIVLEAAYANNLDKAQRMEQAGVEVITVADDGHGHVDLNAALSVLAKWQFNEVLVEAGAGLAGALLTAGLIDEVSTFYSGGILGDTARSMFQFDEAIEFDEMPKFTMQATQIVGEDLLVESVNPTSLARLHPDTNDLSINLTNNPTN